ncbi:MAG: DUF3795 domain-containing protein [Firmicutes bacterium]|nr:DUF3795 domain-containing protein [Bacillota bacterium]
MSNGMDEVAFRDSNQTVLTIYIHKGHYDFQIGEHTVQVSDMQGLEEAKHLILAQKEPNRKPFPKESAIYSRCGHRCDLCVHYTGGSNSEEFRAMLKEHVGRVYRWKPDASVPPCLGCDHGGLNGKSDCPQIKCAAQKGLEKCQDCPEYTNECSPGVGYTCGIEPRSISAKDVTWAILPYISDQYGN